LAEGQLSYRLDSLCLERGGIRVLRSLSLELKARLTYLVGANGSGKTSLLKCLVRALPYSGHIYLGKKKLEAYSPKELARNVAVVPQHFSLSLPLRVLDFVLLGRFPYLSWMGTYQKEDIEYAKGSLETMGVYCFHQRYLNELSGGELQKVCIAQALCQDTKVLLLDEPAQSLDPKSKQSLYSILSKLANNGTLIVCTTHDMEPLRDSTVTVVGLRNGSMVYESTGGGRIVEELFTCVY